MKDRRGSILFGVLLVVVLATLVAATTMLRVRNNTDVVRAAIREDASRACLRSGIAILLSEFSGARPDLIRGGVKLAGGVNASDVAGALRVSDGLVVSETGGRRGIVRLIPHPSGELVLPEAVRLDINTASREMLLALPDMTEPIVDAIIARRSTRPFEAVEELVAIDEITPEFLFGDLELWADRYMPADELARDASVQAESVLGSTVLAGMLTVYASDPDVRCGLESESDGSAGEPRLLFPDEVVEQLETEDGQSLRIRVEAEGLLDSNELDRLYGAENEASFLRRLGSGIDRGRWSELMDVISMNPDPYRIGRVDITNAGVEILLSIPGIDEAAAEEMVSVREGLSSRRLAGVAWPVEEDILTPEQFAEAAPWIATRSLQFRFVVEAGFEVLDGSARSGDFGSIPLEHRIVAEVVIDLSGEAPRIAYLRDVTWLREALRIHSAAAEEVASDDPTLWYDFGDPFEIDAGRFDDDEAPEESVERPRDRIRQQREEMRMNREELRGAETEAEQEPAPDTQTPAGRDRRIGRWSGTPRTGGG